MTHPALFTKRVLLLGRAPGDVAAVTGGEGDAVTAVWGQDAGEGG